MSVKSSLEEKSIVLIVYMNDTRDQEEETGNLKNLLARKFQVKVLGHLRYFLGKEVVRAKKGIYICQRKNILDLLKENEMFGHKQSQMPMDPTKKIGKD